MPELSVQNLLLFAAFVVPGAIAMQVYKLRTGARDRALNEALLEAAVYSVVNFAILYWPITYATAPQTLADRPLLAWAMLLVSLFAAPVVWPLLLDFVLRRLQRAGWIVPRQKTAWDHYFSTVQEGCFVVAQLTDGTYVGGRFGPKSFASGYPEQGHIFIEELWQVDEQGRFTGETLSGQGVILRPSDYVILRVSADGTPEREQS